MPEFVILFGNVYNLYIYCFLNSHNLFAYTFVFRILKTVLHVLSFVNMEYYIDVFLLCGTYSFKDISLNFLGLHYSSIPLFCPSNSAIYPSCSLQIHSLFLFNCVSLCICTCVCILICKIPLFQCAYPAVYASVCDFPVFHWNCICLYNGYYSTVLCFVTFLPNFSVR